MSVIGGIWAAALTPVTADLQPDAGRAIPYYRELLENGCDGINVLGTTGEAMSLSVEQRVRYMRSLASSDLPMARMMAGTGAAALDDAVELTRAALDCGFAAALIMPPFFYREASDDGIAGFYETLLARAKPARKSVLLYNFPRMSGVALHADLVDRLVAASNDRIFGMKDSSNDAALQSEIIGRRPGFAIFPGSENDLAGAKRRGVAGCISGSVALWPRRAKQVFESGDAAQASELDHRRAALDGVPLVGAMRYRIAALRGEPEWERTMPPQEPLSAEQRERLDRALASF
ncbi:MAG TPA: dihydrodipicolinate synthase family protein [Candidatus Acidoferrum sp.]|jgi:4-hydroxy-tetrahydrodipicolinate synthase|nr:dihydrodipicolinate synthase family protein [Candidatus Acidoferrum sp.]